MKVMLAMAAMAAASGCVSAPVMGPSGRALYHIETMGTAKAYAKAASKCPQGYDVIEARQQGAFHVLDVECK